MTTIKKTKQSASKKPAAKRPSHKRLLLQKLVSKKNLRIIVPWITILVIAIAVGILLAANNKDKGPVALTPEQYREQLRSQVQGSDGTPNSGRDPASQGQTDLSDAASTPNGAGARTDTPAAAVNGDHSMHHTSGDVYSDASQTGINSAGCYIDYGIQGQECLPTHAAGSDGKLTCSEVRQYFPNGIKVTGTDRFNLDTNGDKTACGSND